MHEHQAPDRPAFWKTPYGWAFIGFAAIAAFFLITEHTAHVFGVLPWLFILACPLMHIFMHRGHGHGGHRHDRGQAKGPAPRGGEPTQSEK